MKLPLTLSLVLALASLTQAQDSTTLMMRKVAATPDPAEAERLLTGFFRGGAGLQAVVSKVRSGGINAAEMQRDASELARTRAEAKDNPSARLRAGSERMFRQLGSTNLASGSTNAVAKTSATDFLSVALESGAVTSKTDKSTATFQLNALPVWQVLSHPGGPYGCGRIRVNVQASGSGVCETGPGFWLRGLTGSASFNVNSKETAVPVLANGGTNSVVATGVSVLSNPSKLSALGLKYELFQRKRKTADQREALASMAKELNKSLDNSGLALSLSDSADKLINEPFYENWLSASVNGAMAIRSDEAKLDAYAHARLALVADLALENISLKRLTSLQDMQKAYDAFVSEIAKQEADLLFKKSFAFDLVHSRPTDQPFLNTLRLDFSTPLGRHEEGNTTGSSASLDFNAAAAFYHSPQKLGGRSVRLRHASASMALNYRLASWGDLGAPVLTLAGYYQYMFGNGLIEFNSEAFTPGASRIALPGTALEVLNTNGSIGLGQLRLEIPLGKDSGLTFPLAVSYANRTELIKDPNRKYWQGHIGLSYDLNKLQQAFLKQ